MNGPTSALESRPTKLTPIAAQAARALTFHRLWRLRHNTGNFTISGVQDTHLRRKDAVPQRLFAQFPTRINRENISKNREFFAGIREFRVTDGNYAKITIRARSDS